MKPMIFLFSMTGSRLILFLFIFIIASSIVASGRIENIFLVAMSFAFTVLNSLPCFLYNAQMMSFSVRIPVRESFSFMRMLPTLFFTIVCAHSMMDVSGFTCVKFRVMMSPTCIVFGMLFGGFWILNNLLF